MSKIADLARRSGQVLPIFAEMQANGMPASRSHFLALQAELTETMRGVQSTISREYCGGAPFNPKSDDQTRALMARLGIRGSLRTDSGLTSTSAKSIGGLRKTSRPIELIFDYRETEHTRGFCDKVLDYLPDIEDEPDGDIYPVRCRLMPTRIPTRRLAAKDPNMLAMPARTALGRRIRAGFMLPADSGLTFGAWDLSQIEWRVLAHLAQDPIALRFFRENLDIHYETAAMAFRVPIVESPDPKIRYQNIRKDQRTAVKKVNYGVVYGQQAQGLSISLRQEGLEGWGEDECQDLLDTILGDGRRKKGIYEGVADYIRRVQRETFSTGYAETALGMRRYLPAIWSGERKLVAEAGRQAVSHRVSGTAQDMLQTSMAWLNGEIRTLKGTWPEILWRLQIHDELLMSFPIELWEVLDELMIEGLTRHCGVELSVPVLADGHCATSWGELK